MTEENDSPDREAPAGQPLVTVRRQWSDWRQAVYRFDEIDGLHWTNESGGVRAIATRPLLHGYVVCDRMVSGLLAHSGAHGNCPHRIKVCVLKGDNAPEVYRQLVDQAGGEAAILDELRRKRAAQAEVRRQQTAHLAELLKDPVMAAKSDLALARRTGLRWKKIAELRTRWGSAR